MVETVRLSNRGQLRRPVAAGALLVFTGVVLVALTLLLPDVFAQLGSTLAAQAAGGAAALTGLLVVGYVLLRFPLSVEFGEQVRVRWALSERFVEWAEVESLELVAEREDVRPLAPLARLDPVLGAVARVTGAADLGTFDVTTRHVRVRLRDGRTVRCDARRPEWERVAELARRHGVPAAARRTG